MRNKILIIDDNEEERKITVEAVGSNYPVLQASDGKMGLDLLLDREDEIAGIVLALEMDQMDGFAVLEELKMRQIFGRMAVFVLSRAEAPETEIRAFSYPIGDFMRKPINRPVFFMRLRGSLRIAVNAEQQDQFSANVLDMFGDIVEGRDLGGAVHIEHIKQMTRALAENLMANYPEYELTKLKVNEIVEASALHDIGKVAIPDHVLNKPGKLTKEEFDLMKSHTTKGGEMIEHMTPVLTIVHPYDADNFIETAYGICRHHHERFDGRGYPDNLSGDDIPIPAQIVSVADTLDGMTGRTVYKRAIEKEKAFHMIVTGEAGVFSPKLMECMKNVKDTIMNIIGEQDLN